jgi:hypothetical protein
MAVVVPALRRRASACHAGGPLVPSQPTNWYVVRSVASRRQHAALAADVPVMDASGSAALFARTAQATTRASCRPRREQSAEVSVRSEAPEAVGCGKPFRRRRRAIPAPLCASEVGDGRHNRSLLRPSVVARAHVRRLQGPPPNLGLRSGRPENAPCSAYALVSGSRLGTKDGGL